MSKSPRKSIGRTSVIAPDKNPVNTPDTEEFWTVFDRFHERIYSFFYRRTLDAGLAVVLTRDVFLQARENAQAFPGQAITRGGWLFRLALSRWSASGLQVLKNRPNWSGITQGQVALFESLTQLSPADQNIFQLYYWENLSSAEVGVVLDRSIPWVREQLARVLAALRDASLENEAAG